MREAPSYPDNALYDGVRACHPEWGGVPVVQEGHALCIAMSTVGGTGEASAPENGGDHWSVDILTLPKRCSPGQRMTDEQEASVWVMSASGESWAHQVAYTMVRCPDF